MWKELEDTFPHRRQTDGKQAHGKCSLALLIQEVPIKLTIRYHYTLNRIANFLKNSDNTNMEKEKVRINFGVVDCSGRY
jgi:hypothetical protein